MSEIVIDYIKNIDNPSYGIEKYFKTFDLTQGGFVDFKLFDIQKDLIKEYQENRYNLVLKYRQAGISTVTAAYIAILSSFCDPNKPEKTLIIANKLDQAVEFLSKVVDFLKQLPDWIDIMFYNKDGTPKFEKDSQRHIILKNGSEIKAVATSKDALRGYTPTLIIMDEAAFIEGGNKFFGACMASISTGGKLTMISCVPEETYVITDDGIKEVGDFVKEYGKSNLNLNDNTRFVPKYNILGKDKKRCGSLFHDNGVQKTIKLQTSNGFIEGSEEHKVWAFSNKEKKYNWYRLKDLVEYGGYLAHQYGDNIWGNNDDISDFKVTKSKRRSNKFHPNKLTNELLYFIGLYITKGNVYKKIKNGKHVDTDLTLTCADDLSKTLKKLNLKFCCKDGIHYNISSKDLGDFMEYLGFDLTLKNTERIIPKRLLSLSGEKIKYILQGIFDGDGYSRKDKGLVGIGLSSKKLVEQIRIILQNFGILTEYYEVNNRTTKKVEVYSMNYLISCDSHNSLKFYEKIGFNFNRKQKNKKIILEKNLKQDNPHDIIPNGSFYIRKIFKESKITHNELLKHGINITKNTSLKTKNINISRGLFLKFYNFIEERISKELKKEINLILSEKIKWASIKKIHTDNKHVYDFSLYNNENDFWAHSVIYNGILGHQTPNGLDPIYYETYEKAIQNKNDFFINELQWWKDPRYSKEMQLIKTDDVIDWIEKAEDEKNEEIINNVNELNVEEIQNYISSGWKPISPWYIDMCRNNNLDRHMISQELDCSFLGSGENVIPLEKLRQIEEEDIIEPIRKEENGALWIWKDPEEGHRYVAAIDISRGDSDDASGFTIIDFDTFEQVLEYHGKCPPDVGAFLVQKYSGRYKAFTTIDITGGMGVGTSRKLLELNFPVDQLHYDGLSPKERAKGIPEGMVPGINFQAKNNRAQIVAALEESIRKNFKIRSIRLIQELRKFVYKNGKPNHLKGSHDDLIMALGMALYIANTSYTEFLRMNTITKAMLNSWRVTEYNASRPSKTFDESQTFAQNIEIETKRIREERKDKSQSEIKKMIEQEKEKNIRALDGGTVNEIKKYAWLIQTKPPKYKKKL